MTLNLEWGVTAGTIIGPTHRANNTENQDFFFSHVTDTFAVIAVADGAGSLELSSKGAEIAATESVKACVQSILRENIFEQAVFDGLETARQKLLEEPEYKKMGCTLALAAVCDEEWAVGLVGDSFAVLSLDDGYHEYFSVQDASEYANVTKLLTSDEPKFEVFTGPEKLYALSLATDGLEHGSIEGKVPTKGFWDLVTKKAQADELDVNELLKYMDSLEKIMDDTTLVVASYRG